MKSLRQVWKRSCARPVGDTAQQSLGIARSATGRDYASSLGRQPNVPPYGEAILAKQVSETLKLTTMQKTGRITVRLLLWKSFCKVSASGTEPQDSRHFGGDATGSMPVLFPRNRFAAAACIASDTLFLILT